MHGQFVEQAVKTIRRKRRGIGLPRPSSNQAAHPLQPGRVVLATKPSVQGKAAVGEKLRLLQFTGVISCKQFAREEDDLVLPRHDRLIAAVADVRAIFQVRVVNPQFSALELAGSRWKK